MDDDDRDDPDGFDTVLGWITWFVVVAVVAGIVIAGMLEKGEGEEPFTVDRATFEMIDVDAPVLFIGMLVTDLDYIAPQPPLLPFNGDAYLLEIDDPRFPFTIHVDQLEKLQRCLLY